jgi:SSS family solute:Na+ symporter
MHGRDGLPRLLGGEETVDHRFAAGSTASVRSALLIVIILWAAYDGGVTLIGMIARAAVERGMLDGELEGKCALITICMQSLPMGLRGPSIGVILAAAMSSVDSYSLLAAGNIVSDIGRPFRRRGVSDRGLILLTRCGVLATMLAAAGASLVVKRMTDIWVFVSSVLAGVVLVPVMGALFWPRAPRRAAGLGSSAAGLATLAAFYAMVYANGVVDEEAESIVWRLGGDGASGGIEIWRE